MMDALGFEATRFVRPALLTIALNCLVIAISLMTMVKPAHADGTVPSVHYYYPQNSLGIAVTECNLSHQLASPSAAAQCEVGLYSAVHPSGSRAIAYWSNTSTLLTMRLNDGSTYGYYLIAGPATCPANSSGSPCTCYAGYQPDSAGTSCIEAQYTLSVLEDPHPDVEPGSNRDIVVRVMNAKSEPKSGVRVRLKVDVEANSGGHDHHDEHRPKGTLTGSIACDPPDQSAHCATATTGSDGYASFTFSAPSVSGKHAVTAACVNPACTNTYTGRIEVKVPDLHKIPDDPTLYVFIGGEADKPHHDNHYLTDSALSQLVVLAINYHFLYPNESVLHLNDASLEWGGKFDVKGNWAGDHAGHRKGTVIDIRANTASGNIPERLFKDFMRLAKDTKLADGMTSAQAQLHCSTGYDQANYCAGDDNRHFHVILLGVDQ